MAHAISKDSDQMVQMHRLIRAFIGRTSLIVGIVMHWLISYCLEFYDPTVVKLIHFNLEIPKRVSGKQCRPR